MVKKRTLFLIASIVWLIAGWNVSRIGIECYKEYVSVCNVIVSLMVLISFDFFVFSKLVKKHRVRIMKLENERQAWYRFFDWKSFLIMGFMIILGILIRTQSLLSEQWIAVFYSGLGIALILAGLRFFWSYKNYDRLN